MSQPCLKPVLSCSPYREVEKSQTLLLNEQSRNLEASGKEVFKFGFGQSPFPPLQAAVEKLKEHAGAKDYTPVQGIPALREAVASFHKQAEGIDVAAGRVLVAPGSKILIYAVMAAFERADVLVPAPAWVSYRPQAKLLGHRAIKVESTFESRWRVTPDAVEKAVRQKADPNVPSVLIFNYPGNPEGMTYNAAELRALAETFRRHRILVVSDEIYGLLDHQGAHQSLAKFYPEATVVTGGLSKWCGAGGWRLGVAMLPEALDGEFKDAMLGIASETYSCAALPVQLAACAAYQWNKATQDYLFHQRRLLSYLGNRSADKLRAAGVRVHAPQGGFYLFLDFSTFAEKMKKKGATTSQALCARLLADTGVVLLPGDAFGIDPTHLSARLAYIEFDGKEALAASERVGSAALDESLMHGVFAKSAKGIERICDWLAAA
jgi:aspartate aminotransferase